MYLRYILLTFTLIIVPSQLFAAKIRVAVASNFSKAMLSIVKKFESKSDHRVILSFGSTDKHYAQILHGAPFDLFFTADTQRPERLEKEGVAVPGSRFTYAKGKLVLWSPIIHYVDSNTDIVKQGDFRYI